jgi:2'-5' RNA ligase
MPDPEGRLETALWLVLDDAIPLLGAIHDEFAPNAAAKGKPLHVTLLYPFVPRDEIDGPLVTRLERFFSSRPPLAFALARVAEFPEAGVVYAVPEPDQHLCDYMTALWHEFPDTPPYRTSEPDPRPVPHATLGYVSTGERRNAARARASAVLPVEVTASHASLWEEAEADRWRERYRFAFGN